MQIVVGVWNGGTLKFYTLEFLINMQHVYLILTDFSFLHALIRNYTFIEFHEIFTAYETSRYLLEKKLHFGNIFGKKSI